MNKEQAEEANKAEINRLELLSELDTDVKYHLQFEIKQLQLDPKAYWGKFLLTGCSELRKDVLLKMIKYYY